MTTAADTVTGWAIGTVPADPFANVTLSYADELEAAFAADKAEFEARKAQQAETAAEVVDEPAAEVTETVAVIECRKCHRPITSVRSRHEAQRNGGYGRGCARRVAKAVETEGADFKPAQTEKAVAALAEDGGVRRVGHLFLVESSDHSTRYECAASGECTCTAAFYGRRCWHVLTARIATAAGWPTTDADEIGFAPLADADDGIARSTDPLDY